jgi:hypothetical protein
MGPIKLDGQTQVRGKCQYWRERMYEDDRWDTDLKPHTRRVRCSCFVEGTMWEATVGTIPDDCPEHDRCRYHIASW